LKYLSVFILTILISATLVELASPALAQSPSTGTLRGQVTEPSGAVVANATVAILTSGGPTHSVSTTRSGNYEIGNLAPGKYTVTAWKEQYGTQSQDVTISGSETKTLNFVFKVLPYAF